MELSQDEVAILESLPSEQFETDLRAYILTGAQSGHFRDFSMLSRPDKFASLRNKAKSIILEIVKSPVDTSGEISQRLSRLNDIIAKARRTGSSMGRSALL